MASSQDLTELTPVQMGDNTFVKVPMVQREQPGDKSRDLPCDESREHTSGFSPNLETHADLIVDTGLTAPCSGQLPQQSDVDPDTSISYTQTKYKTSLTDKQLQTLVSYYHDVPRDMFKNSILTLYASCDRKLDEVRNDLFVILTRKEDFPFKGHALKRRKQTQKGDSLVEKLAYDIHTLITAIVDSLYDSPDLKEMISSSRKSIASRSGDVNGTPCRPSGVHQSRPEDYPSRSEFKALQENILLLKSDMLTLKQTFREKDTSQTSEISLLKDSLVQVNEEYNTLKNNTCAELCNLTAALLRIEGMVASSTTHVKSDIKLLKQNVQICESNIQLVEQNVQNIVDKTKQSRSKKSAADTGSRSAGRGTSDHDPGKTPPQQSVTNSSSGTPPAGKRTEGIHISDTIDLTVNGSSQSSDQNSRSLRPSQQENGNDINSLQDFPPLGTVSHSSNSIPGNNKQTASSVPPVSVAPNGVITRGASLCTTSPAGPRGTVAITALAGQNPSIVSQGLHVSPTSSRPNASSAPPGLNANTTPTGNNGPSATTGPYAPAVVTTTYALAAPAHNNAPAASAHVLPTVSNSLAAPTDHLAIASIIGTSAPLIPTGTQDPPPAIGHNGPVASERSGTFDRHAGRYMPYANVVGNGSAKRVEPTGQGTPIPAMWYPRAERQTFRDSVSDPQRPPFNPGSYQYLPQTNECNANRNVTQFANTQASYGNSYQDSHNERNKGNTGTDDLDLADFVRKRTRRYYVGGFKHSITEDKIAQYISRRGPKVTKVVIFRNRNKPIVIRVNVEDDSNAQLLCTEYFWPNGVICRPWLSRAQYNARDSESDGLTGPAPQAGRWYQHDYGRSGPGAMYNRYGALGGVD